MGTDETLIKLEDKRSLTNVRALLGWQSRLRCVEESVAARKEDGNFIERAADRRRTQPVFRGPALRDCLKSGVLV